MVYAVNEAFFGQINERQLHSRRLDHSRKFCRCQHIEVFCVGHFVEQNTLLNIFDTLFNVGVCGVLVVAFESGDIDGFVGPEFVANDEFWQFEKLPLQRIAEDGCMSVFEFAEGGSDVF